jgi:hypothetical protein
LTVNVALIGAVKVNQTERTIPKKGAGSPASCVADTVVPFVATFTGNVNALANGSFAGCANSAMLEDANKKATRVRMFMISSLQMHTRPQ